MSYGPRFSYLAGAVAGAVFGELSLRSWKELTGVVIGQPLAALTDGRTDKDKIPGKVGAPFKSQPTEIHFESDSAIEFGIKIEPASASIDRNGEAENSTSSLHGISATARISPIRDESAEDRPTIRLPGSGIKGSELQSNRKKAAGIFRFLILKGAALILLVVFISVTKSKAGAGLLIVFLGTYLVYLFVRGWGLRNG